MSLVRLTADDAAALARALAAELPGARPAVPDGRVAAVVDRLERHLAGQPQDFRAVTLDMAGVSAFRRRVYRALRQVPAGRLVTYAELAALAGVPGAVRAVGGALAANPFPVIVPCHRVVAAGGRPGGFSAAGGLVTKARLLAAEGGPLPPWATRLLAGEFHTPCGGGRTGYTR